MKGVRHARFPPRPSYSPPSEDEAVITGSASPSPRRSARLAPGVSFSGCERAELLGVGPRVVQQLAAGQDLVGAHPPQRRRVGVQRDGRLGAGRVGVDRLVYGRPRRRARWPGRTRPARRDRAGRRYRRRRRPARRARTAHSRNAARSPRRSKPGTNVPIPGISTDIVEKLQPALESHKSYDWPNLAKGVSRLR